MTRPHHKKTKVGTALKDLNANIKRKESSDKFCLDIKGPINSLTDIKKTSTDGLLHLHHNKASETN